MSLEKRLLTHTKDKNVIGFPYRTGRALKNHIFECVNLFLTSPSAGLNPGSVETLAYLFSITRLMLTGKSWETALKVICLLFHLFYSLFRSLCRMEKVGWGD